MRPVVKLKPKADAQAIRHGRPWAYLGDIALDRRTKSLEHGSLVRLEDKEKRPLGLFAFHPGSKIAARFLDKDPDAEIDQAWFAMRLRFALAHRGRLYDTPFYRLIHAEADGFPGVIIDV